jgi:hypothetical protein
MASVPLSPKRLRQLYALLADAVALGHLGNWSLVGFPQYQGDLLLAVSALLHRSLFVWVTFKLSIIDSASGKYR